ncbi:MAG: 1-deoxy-D-xylulose-5-phosphate synthase [Alphaproteobacteria bacterium]|jgi:1-deoxy-D-xylulose-5-phosphate synthase|nr:1-deoxy-D-xylulose-5-phosphate synthase [alpha proteobacterium HIMB59]
MSFLSKINFPKDLKKLTLDELKILNDELRTFTIETVSKTGGHLGASLGVVELTVALHYVFDTPKDKIVWDVGHQTYPHKIITGRKRKIHTLRKKNGLSGFTKRSESIYDPFGAAHSSTSISANLGIAVARDLQKKSFDVISIIGDGAISAGMAFEGLNNIGHLSKNSLIILNDNEMSIAKPVGAMSKYLVNLLSSKTYENIRDVVKNFTKKLPDEVGNFAKKTEGYLKGYLTGNTLFEELGMNYIGPIDGHNLDLLIQLFQKYKEKELHGPVFLHIITEKGKGYAPAENSNDKFHGVSSFDIQTGVQNKSKDKTYTSVISETLLKLAKKDKKVTAITAAMPSGTGLDKFQELYPDRFFDVGIAEQHAVTFAGGMATESMKPFVAIYSTFLQRAYDQVVHDIAIQSLPVRFLIDRSGFVGADGATHAGSFDLTYLCCLPNFIVMAPSSGEELKNMLNFSLSINNKPSAIRYPRDTVGEYNEKKSFEKITLGKGKVIQKGKKIAFLNLGTRLEQVKLASKLIKDKNKFQTTIIDMRFAKPIDTQLLKTLLKNHDIFITVEENAIGGFSSQVNNFFLNQIKKQIKVLNFFMKDEFIDQSDINDQYSQSGISPEEIYKKVSNLLN